MAQGHKCGMEENVNIPDRETSLLASSTDHHQSIGIVPGFPTGLPSGSSTTISFSSSASSSAIDPTRTFTSTTLVQDASEASEVEPLNKEEVEEIKDDDSDKITMCQTKEEVV